MFYSISIITDYYVKNSEIVCEQLKLWESNLEMPEVYSTKRSRHNYEITKTIKSSLVTKLKFIVNFEEKLYYSAMYF